MHIATSSQDIQYVFHMYYVFLLSSEINWFTFEQIKQSNYLRKQEYVAPPEIEKVGNCKTTFFFPSRSLFFFCRVWAHAVKEMMEIKGSISI